MEFNVMLCPSALQRAMEIRWWLAFQLALVQTVISFVMDRNWYRELSYRGRQCCAWSSTG